MGLLIWLHLAMGGFRQPMFGPNIRSIPGVYQQQCCFRTHIFRKEMIEVVVSTDSLFLTECTCTRHDWVTIDPARFLSLHLLPWFLSLHLLDIVGELGRACVLHT